MTPTTPAAASTSTLYGSRGSVSDPRERLLRTAYDLFSSHGLQAIGIDSNVALEPDWGSWFPNAYATKNPTLLWQNGSQGSPYGYFYANLSQNAYIPSGQDGSR